MASLPKYYQLTLGSKSPCSVTRRSFLAVTAALIASPVYGQNDVEGRRESNARLEEMRKLAKGIKVCEITEGEAGPPLALRQDPLLHYTNPTPGGVVDGTLWGWGERGRPPAVMKLGLAGPKRGERHWRLRVNVLSSKSIEVEFGDGVKWSSRRSGLEVRPLIDAPAPADTEPLRLIQAREIGRRLKVSALSTDGKNRSQFRLMPQPLVRYSDPKGGFRDGMLFGFAYTNNPSVLMLLEVWSQGEGVRTWRYVFAHQTDGEATALLDGKTLWKESSVGAEPDTKLSFIRRMPADPAIQD
jgi:hypothetical protein